MSELREEEDPSWGWGVEIINGPDDDIEALEIFFKTSPPPSKNRNNVHSKNTSVSPTTVTEVPANTSSDNKNADNKNNPHPPTKACSKPPRSPQTKIKALTPKTNRFRSPSKKLFQSPQKQEKVNLSGKDILKDAPKKENGGNITKRSVQSAPTRNNAKISAKPSFGLTTETFDPVNDDPSTSTNDADDLALSKRMASLMKRNLTHSERMPMTKIDEDVLHSSSEYDLAMSPPRRFATTEQSSSKCMNELKLRNKNPVKGELRQNDTMSYDRDTPNTYKTEDETSHSECDWDSFDDDSSDFTPQWLQHEAMSDMSSISVGSASTLASSSDGSNSSKSEEEEESVIVENQEAISVTAHGKRKGKLNFFDNLQFSDLGKLLGADGRGSGFFYFPPDSEFGDPAEVALLRQKSLARKTVENDMKVIYIAPKTSGRIPGWKLKQGQAHKKDNTLPMNSSSPLTTKEDIDDFQKFRYFCH
jgi:hypothetical protein